MTVRTSFATILLFAVASGVSAAGERRNDPFNAIEHYDMTVQTVESGIAHPGSPLWAYFKARVPGMVPNRSITYSFTYNGVSNISLKKLLESNIYAKWTYAIPDPIDHLGPGENFFDVDSIEIACHAINDGPTPGSARMVFNYTWENRDDTDNDGVNDSNPGWVFTGASYSQIEWYTAEDPLGDGRCIG